MEYTIDTREKLRRLLTEWNEFTIPPLFERTFNDALLSDAHILTLIGPRRAVKTFLCYQIVQRLRKTLPPGNVAYINLEDERLNPFKGDEKQRKRTLIVETHSEHLILRLLRRIRETTEGKLLPDAIPLRPEDLSVIYVEQTDKGAKVSKLRIDESGEFIDRWPKGFFEERVDEIL